MAKDVQKTDITQIHINEQKFLSTFDDMINGIIEALMHTFITGNMTFSIKELGGSFIIFFKTFNLAHKQITDIRIATIRTDSGIHPNFSKIYDSGIFNKFSPPTII